MDLLVTPGSTPDGPLEGRALMLNTAKAIRFQCYGFVVTRNIPLQVVPRQASESKLREALAAGVLLDVTGKEDLGATGQVIKNIDRAVRDGTLTGVKEGEPVGQPVLVGRDAKGNSYVIIPKDAADYERMQAELKENGHLRVAKPKDSQSNFTGLTPIYEQELPLQESQE